MADPVPEDDPAADDPADDPVVSGPVAGWRDRARSTADRVGRAAGERHRALIERTSWAGLVTDVVDRSRSGNGSVVAGLLAYRLFLLLLPLGAIVVALAGFDRLAAEGAAGHLGLGRSITTAIATAGSDVERSRVPLLLTAVGAFILTSWGLLGALQYTAATAWGIPTRRFPGKGRTLLRLAGSVLLFVVVLYLSVVVRRAGLFAGLAASTANSLAAFVGFLGLGWILPRRSKEWFWLVPGAAVGAIGLVTLQLVASYWLPGKVATASDTYGVFGSAVAVLGFLFMVGVLVWLALLVNAVTWERHHSDPPGILRRIAELVPFPSTSFGSGYVGEDEEATTVTGGLRFRRDP